MTAYSCTPITIISFAYIVRRGTELADAVTMAAFLSNGLLRYHTKVFKSIKDDGAVDMLDKLPDQ